MGWGVRSHFKDQESAQCGPPVTFSNILGVFPYLRLHKYYLHLTKKKKESRGRLVEHPGPGRWDGKEETLAAAIKI
jgi:hypothetical protein